MSAAALRQAVKLHQVADGKQLVEVWCNGFDNCGWFGRRQARTAAERPCPRCGGRVHA